jgi:hypothetical protein
VIQQLRKEDDNATTTNYHPTEGHDNHITLYSNNNWFGIDIATSLERQVCEWLLDSSAEANEADIIVIIIIAFINFIITSRSEATTSFR